MAYASWESYPTPEEVKSRIDEFVAALARGDLTSAFELCPVRSEGEIKNPSDRHFFDVFLDEALYQYFEEQPVLDGETLDQDHKVGWLRFLTSPLGHTDEEQAFEMPSAGAGEVVINIPLKGEMTDISGHFSLHDVAGAWHLYFDSFDML